MSETFITWLSIFLKQAWWGLIPFEQQQLLLGFVFGFDLAPGSWLKSSIKNIGMSHVASASGYNVQVMQRVAGFVVGRFWRLWRLLLLGGVVCVYAITCGFTPSIVRAAVAALLRIAATGMRRHFHPGRGLFVFLCCTAVIKYEWLVDIRFQLSVMAVLGLQIWQGNDQLAVAPVWWKQPLHDGWSSFAVLTTTFPIILTTFHSWPAISLFANAALLWITPVITILGVVYLFLTPFWAIVVSSFEIDWLVRWLLGLPLRVVVGFFVAGVDFFNYFSSYSIQFNWKVTHSLIWYLLLALCILIKKRTSNKVLQNKGVYD